jgi:hypothetical protein
MRVSTFTLLFLLVLFTSFSIVKKETYKAKIGYGRGKLTLKSDYTFKQSYNNCTENFVSTGSWLERNDTIYLKHLIVSNKSRITSKSLKRYSIFYRENKNELTSMVYEINDGTIMFKIKYFK